MEHAHKVIDFSTIHENIIDDYYQHIAHIPHIMNSLDLFQLFPPSEFRAPIPPPKHPNDDNSESVDDNAVSTTIPGDCDTQHEEAIGLGITPSTVAETDESQQCQNAIALEDYDAQGVGDLSFHKNQQFEILGSLSDQHQDGWLTAQINGQVGLVPSDHVKLLEQEQRIR